MKRIKIAADHSRIVKHSNFECSITSFLITLT